MPGYPDAIVRGVWLSTQGQPGVKVTVCRCDGGWLLRLVVESETEVLIDQVARVPDPADAAEIDDKCRGILAIFNPSAPRWLDGEQLAREFREYREAGR